MRLVGGLGGTGSGGWWVSGMGVGGLVNYQPPYPRQYPVFLGHSHACLYAPVSPLIIPQPCPCPLHLVPQYTEAASHPMEGGWSECLGPSVFCLDTVHMGCIDQVQLSVIADHWRHISPKCSHRHCLATLPVEGSWVRRMPRCWGGWGLMFGWWGGPQWMSIVCLQERPLGTV